MRRNATAASARASRPSIRGLSVGTTMPTGVGVLVGVPGITVGVLVGVPVGVKVGVLVWVPVGVAVAVGVLVGVLVGVFVGVLVGVFVGVLVGVFVGVFVGVLVGATMAKQVENSDVSIGASEPTASNVAVAVMTFWPPGMGKTSGPKVAPQPASVVTVVDPRKVCPSPLPEGSHEAFEKNSIRKELLAVLSRVPEIVTFPPAMFAEVITG
jgi:hypothetical protein